MLNTATGRIVRKHKVHGNAGRLPAIGVLLLGLFFFGMNGLMAQKIRIVLGPSKIGANEVYTITLTAQDTEMDEYGGFPNIPGFSKAGTSSSSSMSSFNGRVSNEMSIIQNYMPNAQGTFTIPPFSMKVNGQVLRSPGGKVTVGPPVDNRSSDPFGNPFAYDPFEDFYPKTRASGKADAFFSIEADKKEIWAGEGVNITISFFVSEENGADMNFYQPGEQLDAFLKVIKPQNSWEENFGLDAIENYKVKIGAKSYTEYRLYQGTIFPLTPKDIVIPALKLKMLTYKGGASFFGARPDEQIKAFESRPLRIRVKDLPPHPLKGKVCVGQFSLGEKLDKARVRINEGVSYDLAIQGEGNITTISEPLTGTSAMLDLYPPNTQQTIQRSMGKVRGSKTFSYLLVPKESGRVDLSKLFSWVYFNTQKGRYDTLYPKAAFSVQKGKATTAGAAARKQDSFYDWIDKADPRPFTLEERKREGLVWINTGIGSMALISLILAFIRKRKKS